MAKGVLKLRGNPVTVIIEKCRNIIDNGLTANINFTTPSPDLPTMTGLIDDLEAKYNAASHGGKLLKADMRTALNLLLTNMSLLLDYINNTSGGDPNIITSALIELRDPNSPVGLLPPPGNRRAEFGLHDGQIIFRYGGVPGRIIYFVQFRVGFDQWIDGPYTGKTRVVISGLNSGQEYTLRVATISAAGIGAWSDGVTQKAL